MKTACSAQHLPGTHTAGTPTGGKPLRTACGLRSLDALDDGKGALPYDVYQIEELPCEANEDKVLLEPFLVTVSKDMVTVNLGTITNDYEPVPEIRTTAAVQDTGGHYGYAGETTVIVDTVEYQNLTKDEEYTLKGTLVDQETGEPVLAGGEAVAAEATFTASAAYGSVALTFTLDSSSLKGKAVVAFERLYHGGKEVAAHTDLEDAGQTVTFLDPSLSTLAVDGETREHVGFPAQEAEIVDEVSLPRPAYRKGIYHPGRFGGQGNRGALPVPWGRGDGKEDLYRKYPGGNPGTDLCL